MGEGQQERLSMGLGAPVRLESVGGRTSSDAGLLAHREMDERLGLTEMAHGFLTEQRVARSVQHQLVPLARQSVCSRLVGYPDSNDADRVTRYLAVRLVMRRRGSERSARAAMRSDALRRSFSGPTGPGKGWRP